MLKRKDFWLKALAVLGLAALLTGPALTAFPVYAADSRIGGSAATYSGDGTDANSGGTDGDSTGSQIADSGGTDSITTDTPTPADNHDSGGADTGGAGADGGDTCATATDSAGADTGTGDSGNTRGETVQTGNTSTDSPPAPDSRLGSTAATGQPSYQPGETVDIAGSGFAPNSQVTVTLTDPSGTVTWWIVTADDSGNIATGYALTNSTEGLYFVQLSDGISSAYTIFTDPSNPTYLFPTNDVHTELSEQGPGSQHSNQVDDGAGTVWPNTPPNDGSSTYVYTSSNTWKRDIYQFENLPGNYDLGGGTASDSTPPDTPAPYSTSHTVNVWSNDPTVVMAWQGVSDAPGSGGTGATVTITAVAREHDGQGYMQFVVVTPARPTGVTVVNPDQGNSLTGSWTVYTYTFSSDPNDGSAWATNSINNLQAGLQLKANCQAQVTQMYLVITPGGGESSSGLKGYNWYWDNPPTSFTTGTTVTQTLSDGSHNFAVNAEDNAGNTSPFGTSGPYLIDTQDPNLIKSLTGTFGNEGWYTSPVLVALHATDDLSGVDYIMYSTDGGNTWTTATNTTISGIGNGKSSTFDTSFTLSEDGIISLAHKTQDVAGNEYELAAQQVKIDLTDPTLVKDLSGTEGKNGWYVSPVLVTLTATDATSGVYEIRYTVDGSETTVPGGPEGTKTAEASFTLSDNGVYGLTHETSDYAGHNTVLAAQEVRIDQTPPSLAKSAARTGMAEITVTLTGTDATSGVDYIKYSVDGGETWAQAPVVNGYGPNTFQATFTIEGVGEHNLSHLVLDVAGNQYVLADQTMTIEGTIPGSGIFTPRLVITVDMLGTTAEYPVTPEGRLIDNASTTSPDGAITLYIPAGTLVLNADSTPTYLNEDYDIVFKPAGTPPAPAGYEIVAAYQASPTGVTFSPDVRLIVTYDEKKLPAGSSAVIAYYDEAKNQWTPLETAGYVAAGGIEMPNTVVSRVGHFTYFAVLAKLPAGK